ncbi:MAG: hypothetical protein PUC12_02455 [Clostridiales bacterium]|nr:hypothetical protein [Clostridiales bacterium]
MKKSIFDKMSDSYENFHLKESKIGGGTVTVSPKLKLTLGWSLFILCCVLAYIFLGMPFVKKSKTVTQQEKKAVLDEKVKTDEEHDTIIPYEKDVDDVLNEFITNYFTAITSCDYLRLQDMVTNADEYSDDVNLKKKAEFITGYDNITVYTKAGLEEDSYIAFVVANLTIAGVNSSPYDIMTLYIVNGERGYMINNGELTSDVKEYIEKVKGDADIQKVYKSVEKKNAELKEKDASLQQFYDTISGKDTTSKTSEKQTGENTEASEVNSENTVSEENQENVQAEENTDNGQGDEVVPEQ